MKRILTGCSDLPGRASGSELQFGGGALQGSAYVGETSIAVKDTRMGIPQLLSLLQYQACHALSFPAIGEKRLLYKPARQPAVRLDSAARSIYSSGTQPS